jgi:ketosteroid isomerase-like protein
MADDRYELVQQICAVWSRGDLEGTIAFIDDDASWEPSGRFIGSGETYRGHEGVRRFWDIFREPWESISLEPLDFAEVDESRILTRTRFRGTGRASGLVTETELYVVWTIADGKLSRYQSFGDRSAALESAGLGGTQPQMSADAPTRQ